MAAAAALMMSDDDDDAEPQISAVERYYLLDSANREVCFSTLPFRVGDTGDLPENKEKRLALWGVAEPGIKVYKEVVAWRLGLEGKQPDIAVLPADGGGWIRLVKPINSYEEIIRTVLITAQMLHFLKRKPDEPVKNLWRHLHKAFDKFDVSPSENDFSNHRSLMKECAEKDPVLAKSEILQAFVEGSCRKNIGIGTDNIEIKQPFIADDDDIDDLVTEDTNNESDEDDEDLFDSICAICDDGGDLLCCDGPCMRSFHAKEGTGEDSYCETLGYTEAEVEAMKIFLCKNCEHKQHQCFVCGVLEPSDGAAAKVFLCNNATCGHFYHPKCVARQLFPNNKNEASELEKQIANGLSFTCPIHWCFHCKGLEDRAHEPLQFAVCRRCPKSYHRKCLPREISFKNIEDENIIPRAWELSKRILIYCLDHEIDCDIDTPVRDHIIFPQIEKPARGFNKGAKTLVKRKKCTYSESVLDQSVKDSAKMPEKVHVPLREHIKQTGREASAKISTKNLVDGPEKKKAKFLKEKIQLELNTAKDAFLSSLKPAKEQDQQMVSLPSSAAKKIPLSSFPVVDNETEKRVIALLQNEVSSMTIKDISRKCIVPSTHVYSGRQIDRLIPQGKIERSVEAAVAALKKLDNEGNVNDAKAVCEPDVLRQLAKWHSKLRVYISPFIHGTRYSSFGRHFTKVEKLVEIVDKLHWYVEPGDTIVDFCCGANHFSRLMKEKLDKVQKKCRFKNYDLIQPQDRFCFEKRDWMTVQPKELPEGSQLIMGLNPPFGVKASLANKFIDKALTFKPKLIVLIVPKETKRLDQKKKPYDLIWEDIECLSGKAFYLPGSVDLNDKTVDGWNASAPPLYLWSRPDWTKKYMKVAEEHNHTYLRKIVCHVEEHNLSDELPVQEGAETSDKLQEHNLSDDLPMRNEAEATNIWNSKSGSQRETINKNACNVRDTNLLDDYSAKKQARSEEEKDSGTITIRVQEANTLGHLPVNKQIEATNKVISQSGNEKENGRYSNRISNKKRGKSTADHVESLPPEKQVEVAYEETNVIIPSKKSVCNEQKGARHEDRTNVHVRETKSAYHSYEQRAAQRPNIKFRAGGDSEISILSPDSSNSRGKSRSYSPIVQAEPLYDRTAHSNSYMSFPAIETYDSTLNKATDRNYLTNSDDNDAFMRKTDHTYAYIDSSSRKRSSSIEDPYAPAPSGDPYSLQPRGNDDSFHGRQMSEEWNPGTARNRVTDVPLQGYPTRYGGLVSDSYLQASRIPPSTDSQAGMLHGGTGADDSLHARYTLGSSDARYNQPASTAPLFGLSGASAQRGSVMDKYAYGLSGPVRPQSSVMDRYAAPLGGTNSSSPNSMFPQRYPFGQPGSSGAGWPHN